MKSADLSRYRGNLQGEIDSAALYRALAGIEAKPELSDVYRRLAEVEETHARFWSRKIAEQGKQPPPLGPGWRARILIWLARRFGPELILPTVQNLEAIDRDHYDLQAETEGTPMRAQERSHARVLKSLADRTNALWDGSVFSRLEGRHGAGGGNALRAAVLGANDGLVSNLSLVMGVAGAEFSQQTVLITGLAGLLAGACSMAMGEWLSVQSSRELYQKQIATEADELEQVPEEEMEELRLIYQAKGLDHAEAKALAGRVIADKGAALDTLVREELGINPDDLGGSAWIAAISSFAVFVVGAIVPVAPFLVFGGATGVLASAAASATTLFLIGAAITVFTGRGVLFSGTRQLLIGMSAAAITYGVGTLLGTAIRG